jgi:hypothetical protein
MIFYIHVDQIFFKCNYYNTWQLQQHQSLYIFVSIVRCYKSSTLVIKKVDLKILLKTNKLHNESDLIENEYLDWLIKVN